VVSGGQRAAEPVYHPVTGSWTQTAPAFASVEPSWMQTAPSSAYDVNLYRISESIALTIVRNPASLKLALTRYPSKYMRGPTLISESSPMVRDIRAFLLAHWVGPAIYVADFTGTPAAYYAAFWSPPFTAARLQEMVQIEWQAAHHAVVMFLSR
jgi:hypothetical protein